MPETMVHDDYTVNLLTGEDNDSSPSDGNVMSALPQAFPVERALPVALLAALAMASTAATSYFAFMSLLCKDPLQCKGPETTKYAGFTAVATCVANVLGMSALGYLQKLAATDCKFGLLLWMVIRSLSAVMLLIGVAVGNIYVALSSRAFEGLASDNLLHFTLNSIYAQAQGDRRQTSSMISYSLAIYMVGISVSPIVAGLFGNFSVSCFIAIGLFSLSITYTQVFIKRHVSSAKQWSIDNSLDNDNRRDGNNIVDAVRHWLIILLSPLRPFQNQPIYILIGSSLFTYNIIQSYMFNALLVYTSVNFGFTGKENGFVISIAHSIAAFYVFATLFLLPRMTKSFRAGYGVPLSSRHKSNASSRRRDFILALISLSVQALSLLVLVYAIRPWQLYTITIFLAIGLPTPSFIKAYFVSFFEIEEGPMALAGLAVVEISGSLVGPLLFGGLQAYFVATGSVFYFAAGLTGLSLMLLSVGGLLKMLKTDGDGSVDSATTATEVQ